MVRFTQHLGAARCQTFADEARSEGYVGVEGDDPSIYWTYKASGHNPPSAHPNPNPNPYPKPGPNPVPNPNPNASPNPAPAPQAGGEGSRSTFGGNNGKTSGCYAIDLESGLPITTEHPAVLFNDRVTQQNTNFQNLTHL